MFGISAFAQPPFAALAIYVYSNTVTEPLSVADVLVGTANFPISQTEPVSLADALVAAANFPVNQTEPVTLADASSQVTAYKPTATEPITLADASTQVTAYKPTAVENITLADTSTQVTAYKPIAIEPITVADAITQTTAYKPTAVENVRMGDTSTPTTAYKPAVTEPVTLADTSTQTTAYKPTAVENVSPADTSAQATTYSSTAVENLSLADTALAPVNFPVTQTEPIVLEDSSTQTTAYTPTAVENITLADIASQTTTYSASINEPITLADVATQVTSYAETAVEPFLADDTSSQVTAYTSTAIEPIIVADSSDHTTSYYANQVEPISLADLFTATAGFVVAQSENITLLDAQTAVTAYTQYPVENITLFDSTAITGWITIKDDQLANWTLVNDSSGTTLPNIRDWIASETNGETTLVVGYPTSGAYYVARKYKQSVWNFSPLPFDRSTYAVLNIRWLEDRFYLVGRKLGTSDGFIATSTDGLTWTEITVPSGSNNIYDIARNGDTLVIAAIGRVYYSTNSGTSWTSTTRTLSSSRPSILWVEELNKFFVVGFNAYSSPDGATWTSVATGGQGTFGYTGIAWSGSELVIAISNSSGTNSRLQRSSDGVSWTIFGAGNNYDVTKVMWDGTQFLYYGDGSSLSYSIYTGSGNALTPNPNSISGYRVVNTSTSYNMVIVDGLYVIPGYQNDASKNYFYTSTDLVTFSIPEYPGPWSLVGDAAPTTWQNINTLN